jgi:hypothetical protein
MLIARRENAREFIFWILLSFVDCPTFLRDARREGTVNKPVGPIPMKTGGLD